MKAIEVVPKIEEGLPRLRFQQGRPSEAVTRFSEFADGVRAILPGFLESNSIPAVNGIWLSYRNELSAQRYPEFNHEGSFQIGRILNFFKSNLAPVGSCVPPFRAEFSMKIETLPDRFLRFRVEDVPTSGAAHINMFLEYNGLQKQEARNVEAVFQELDEAHGLILGAFSRHFSGEALEIFSR